jgi:hypothetical protein
VLSHPAMNRLFSNQLPSGGWLPAHIRVTASRPRRRSYGAA